MRIDKYLAQSGAGKRKEVREWIKAGEVKVNGEIMLEPSQDIDENCDNVFLKDKEVKYKSQRYIMLNKPKGYVTAKSDNEHRTVFECLSGKNEDLFHVGRLDKDTEGLLLFTNDGEFEHRLMSPQKHMTKCYFFWALGDLDFEKCNLIREGVYMNKGALKAKPGELKILEKGVFSDFEGEIAGLLGSPIQKGKLRQHVVSGEIIITEGKKHQVKKMLKAVGCHVIYLRRIRIGRLKLPQNLKLGEYRELTEEELSYFE